MVCHDEGDPNQWYRSTYHSRGALGHWNHDISIALTDDPTTISLSSAKLGWILRASLIDGKIVPKIDTRLELFPVEVFDQDVRAEWIRRTTVFGDSILYYHGLLIGASNSSLSMAEYRGGEWVKEYNASQPEGTFFDRMILKSKVAFLHNDRSHENALMVKQDKWRMLAENPVLVSTIDVAELSGDCAFLGLIDLDRVVQLYSSNPTLIC